MSGIAGILERESSAASLSGSLQCLLDSLAHRGSGAARTWAIDGIALGATVFHSTPEALLDRQPTIDCESGMAIIWDGRLDNHSELTRGLQLEEEGLSDAMIVLHAYKKWDTDCANRLLGDFAFAIWNPVDRVLFAARDVIGVKPFCYSVLGEKLYFASEVQALLNGCNLPCDLDEVMVADFLLSWSAFPDKDRTFYSAVRRLPPAHWLRWQEGKPLIVRRYWSPDPKREILYRDRREYLDEFKSLLTEAVRCRMRSLGPIGISLSGGMDSSAVMSVAAQLDPCRPLHAFCVKEPCTNESSIAEAAARECGAVFHCIEPPEERTIAGAEVPLEWTATPFGNLSWQAEHCFSSCPPRQGVRVLLKGEYADELFPFSWAYIADLIRTFRFPRLMRELGPIAAHYGSTRTRYLKFCARYLPPAPLIKLYKRLRWQEAPFWIRPELAARTRLVERLRSPEQRIAFTGRSVQESFFSMTKGRSVLGTEWTDIVSARHGFEYRYPYADRRLVEFMCAVPWHESAKNGHVKSFLQESTGLLPKALAEAKVKADYRGYYESTARKHNEDTLRALFDAPPPQAAEYVNLPRAKEMCAAYLLHGNHSEVAISLALFYLWLENSGHRNSPARRSTAKD